MNWGLIEMALQYFKEERMSWGGFSLLILIGYFGYAWATDVHKDLVTREEVDRLMVENKKTIEKTLKLLEDHVKDFELKSEQDLILEATNAVREAKRDLRLAKLDSSMTPRELREYEEYLTHAQEYKQCLIDRRPNCAHLRIPE